ncbi:RodZ domain-containing protein [Moraxella oculi]|uniref:RodZ domain-containing protein n=1 Tax=Moraxella oculi TaxID=2940516 RepID=A0ABW8U6L4_9GAMM
MVNQLTNESKPTSNFGSRLKSARHAKGLTIDEASGELNILKRYLQAFEEEDFAAMPKFAFAKGFIINYAKYLGLDAVDIALTFEKAYPSTLRQIKVSDIKAPLVPMGTLQRGRSKVRINPALIFGAAALIVLVFVLLKVVSNAIKDNKPSPQQHSSVMTQNDQAVGAAITTDMATLEVRSKGDVHVLITDAAGNVLLQGDQPRGNYTLQGVTPIKVKIDDPAQVDLNFNGEAVKLGEYVKDGKASLTLQ